MRVGVEVGGTFTDLVLIDDGKLRVAKVLSTPGSPDIGVNALPPPASSMRRSPTWFTARPSRPMRRWSESCGVCFFTTKGARDILLLQRHDKTAIYDQTMRNRYPCAHAYFRNRRGRSGRQRWGNGWRGRDGGRSRGTRSTGL